MSLTGTTLEEWKNWAGEYTMLPFIRKYALPPSWRVLSWQRAWEAASEYAFVLESGKVGRYSFLGLQPVAVIRGKGENARSFAYANCSEGCPQAGSGAMGSTEQLTGKPLQLLKRWMAPYRSPQVQGLPKFTGGCVGYLSYDVMRSLERIPSRNVDDLELDDYVFMRVEEVWIIDHEENELICAVHQPWNHGAGELGELYTAAEARAFRMKELWDHIVAIADDSSAQERHAMRIQMMEEDRLQVDAAATAGMKTVFPREDFEQAVRRIQQYISQGDVFQVNLSLRQSRTLQTSPEQLYEWLRLFNPSPYMGLLRFPDFRLVSASPELLVKLEQGRVSTRPIAGTRRRGRTEQEDMLMAEELLNNEKERAEHIMLVDLERNDLGRISKYGSVRVSELMAIERYSHVMHLVSEVEGELADGKDGYDVLAATFPGGTITGAPKIRTMEIIEELEPVRRGPYTGSFGWIDYNGNLEFNIIIRTLTVIGPEGYIQTGAGIVIDSDPEREYAECFNKAKALWKAIQYSEREEARRSSLV